MKISNDTRATILGAVIGTLTAAQPVINSVEGSFNQSDWFKLATAIGMFLFGLVTNRKE